MEEVLSSRAPGKLPGGDFRVDMFEGAGERGRGGSRDLCIFLSPSLNV